MQLVRAPHPDQVHGDAAPLVLERRHRVTPSITPTTASSSSTRTCCRCWSHSRARSTRRRSAPTWRSRVTSCRIWTEDHGLLIISSTNQARDWILILPPTFYSPAFRLYFLSLLSFLLFLFFINRTFLLKLFRNELVEQAQLDAEFVCPDIYSFKPSGAQPCKIVFTSHGTVCWLVDLQRCCGNRGVESDRRRDDLHLCSLSGRKSA